MEMKLFSLTRSNENVPVKLQIKVIGSLSSFSDNDLTFDEYKSLKEMFGALAKSLKETEFIVIAVAGNIYNSTKLKIMNALSLKSEEDATISERLRGMGIDDELIAKNAAMPCGATVFQSADGIYSGFAVKKGNQTIAMIPLDEPRTDSVLKRGLIPYLTNGGRLNRIYEEPKNTAAAEKYEPEQPVEINREIVVKTIGILRENDVKIAINGNTNSVILKEFGEGVEGFDEYFDFTPHIEDKGDYSVTDYAAQLAKAAREMSDATLGACVSDIYTSDECDYICIAVATDKSALVRKIYKDSDETDEMFMRIAAEELFSLISEKAAGNSAVGIEVAEEEEPEEKKLEPKTKKIIISVIAIILVLAIVTGILFFVKKKKDEQATTTTLTTTTTTTTTTQAPVVIETKPLSEMMIAQFLENADKENASDKKATPGPVPLQITVNDEQLDAKQVIARIVEAEMGKAYNPEAIKAQAVLTYTYLRYMQSGWKISGVKMADKASDEVTKAVNEVFGQYITVDGNLAFTPYFNMSAGKSASSETVFSAKTNYLVSADCSSDKLEKDYKRTVEVKAPEIRAAINAYDPEIKLEEDDTKLISVKSHDKCVDNNTGYVSKMTVGDKEISGYEFIYGVLKKEDVNSVCFSVEYDAESGSFKFTLYGKGFGVGMSQQAANYDAGKGKKYDAILKAYFKGIKIEKDTANGTAGTTATTKKATANSAGRTTSRKSTGTKKRVTTTVKRTTTKAARPANATVTQKATQTAAANTQPANSPQTENENTAAEE